MRSRLIVCGMVFGPIAGLSAAGLTWRSEESAPSVQNETVQKDSVAKVLAEPVDSRDEALRTRIVGTWEDFYEGNRTMVVKADGTLRLKLELTGAKAWAFVPTSYYDINWKIEDGQFKKTMTGGEPEHKVKWVMRIYGTRADERILELSESRLWLLDADGERKYDWKRKL